MSRLDVLDGEIRSLLTPENCALTLIDYQRQPVFHAASAPTGSSSCPSQASIRDAASRANSAARQHGR